MTARWLNNGPGRLPAHELEGRHITGKSPRVHAVEYRATDAWGRRLSRHFVSLCGAFPRGDSEWGVGTHEVTCPKCLERLAAMRVRDAERVARRAKNRAEWPGDPACSCHGAGCCACLSALPALDTCADCRHVSRCTALGFTSSPNERACSFIPSRYSPRLPPGGGLGEGGPMSAPRVRLKLLEARPEAVGDGGLS